jgi:NAD(P)-dependent dehydrogenase (short-subunit alcohol dehydrogenase family)
MKAAIVTGSGRGLGRAMAIGLAQAGLRVLVTDIDQAMVAETTDEIESLVGAGSAKGLALDLTSEGAAEELVAYSREKLGGLHVLVNNAGVGPEIVRKDFLKNPPKIWEVPMAAWRKTFSINTEAPFLMARAAVPVLLAEGWGRIINVTTSLDTMMAPGYAPYGGSKAANEAHSAILARELKDSGVTVNILVPGGPANTRLIPQDAPLRREDLIQPEAMVPPLTWLVSTDAEQVTGLRFLASRWDRSLSPAEAAEKAGSPIGWPQLSTAQMPPGWTSNS